MVLGVWIILTLLDYMLPLVPKGNITLRYIGQLTSSGLHDHSGNLFHRTLEYVHADGAEHLLLAYKKFPHTIPMGFFWQKYIAFYKPSICIYVRVTSLDPRGYLLVHVTRVTNLLTLKHSHFMF